MTKMTEGESVAILPGSASIAGSTQKVAVGEVSAAKLDGYEKEDKMKLKPITYRLSQ
jgi:D-lyxose ketol-isomerase